MTAHEQPTSARPRTAAGPRVTSRDVARAAGVSQAAVSLVLGDKWRGRVSPHKAESRARPPRATSATAPTSRRAASGWAAPAPRSSWCPP
ncbi:hypothetical protein SRIMM317S_01454 [Streptomyces rimosus subsp. rimosus]